VGRDLPSNFRAAGSACRFLRISAPSRRFTTKDRLQIGVRGLDEAARDGG
jgi:hypothetical protein